MVKPFDNISTKGKEKILKLLKSYTVNHKKNDIIVKDSDEVGIIIYGYLQIIRTNYNGTNNIVDEFYEDDILSTDLSYTYSNEYEIIAKENTSIIFFNYNDLIEINENEKNYNQFLKNLFIILNEKMIERNERIQILTKRTIRNKLLEYFNITSRKNGSRYIYLPFNFSDLADYLAIDRSAMSREIGYLKEEGIIEVKGKRITLLYR